MSALPLPKVLIVDNIHNDPKSDRALGLESVYTEVSFNVVPERIVVLQGINKVLEYAAGSQLEDEENLILFVHQSFCVESPFEIRRALEREAVTRVCNLIQEKNPRARTIIYGFALGEPLPHFVKDAKADGFWDVIAPPEDLERIINQGPVTDKEMRERGHTIENSSTGIRVTGEGFRVPIYREREGD
jgi:hypothetical protein